MTFYTIEPGYPSFHTVAAMSAKLRAVVAAIQAKPERIVLEVLRLEPDSDHREIEELVQLYRAPTTGGTLRAKTDEDGMAVVHQCASGTGEERRRKESCRRAFVRLVMDAMHRERMEITVTVH